MSYFIESSSFFFEVLKGAKCLCLFLHLLDASQWKKKNVGFICTAIGYIYTVKRRFNVSGSALEEWNCPVSGIRGEFVGPLDACTLIRLSRRARCRTSFGELVRVWSALKAGEEAGTDQVKGRVVHFGRGYLRAQHHKLGLFRAYPELPRERERAAFLLDAVLLGGDGAYVPVRPLPTA